MIRIRDSLYVDARGISACSRWSSVATPPECRYPTTSTPAGVPAPRYAIHTHLAPLPPRLCNKEPGTHHRHGMAHALARVSRRCRSWFGWHSTGRGWRGGSRPSSRRSQAHALPVRLHARIEEGVVHVGRGDHFIVWLSLARGLRSLHRQRLGEIRCSGLHRQAGGTSSSPIIPGGIHFDVSEVRDRIRRKVSRLIGGDAHDAGTPAGVQMFAGASFPVVSLRSTTGYKLTFLRDEGGLAP